MKSPLWADPLPPYSKYYFSHKNIDEWQHDWLQNTVNLKSIWKLQFLYILYYIIFTFIFNILVCNDHLYIERDNIFYYQTQMWDLVTWLCYLWQNGTSPLGIAKRLGYISVIDVLKLVTEESVSMVRAVCISVTLSGLNLWFQSSRLFIPSSFISG